MPLRKAERRVPVPPDWGAFQGYAVPTTTGIPDELLDWHLPFLSGGEAKALLYICRRTYGFKRDCDDISLSQMLDGRHGKDGRRQDNGVGLSKKSLFQALDRLEEKGLIFRLRHNTPDKGHETTTYAVNRGNPALGGESTPRVAQPLGEKVHQGLGGDPPPTPRGRKYTTQQTEEGETVGHTGDTPLLSPQDPASEPWPPNAAITGVFDAWSTSLPPGTRRTLTEAREKDIRSGLRRLAKRQPQTVALQDALDAVQGWRWDDWERRDQNNDIEDCLRDSNWEKFRDWERGVNRPTVVTTPALAESNGHQPNGYRPSKAQALSDHYLREANQGEPIDDE